jgi:type 1 glutamine amidotransferase
MRLLSLACLFLSVAAFAADPPRARKVVLIAGPLDASHPPGTHEYEKTVRAFKYCLENAANVRNIRVEAHLRGWPEKPSTLDDADTIVFVSSGSDRKETDHPLLVGNRLAVIEKQMQRGCGLCLIHWSTFVPKEKAGDKVLEWVGGYFDYQSGPAKNGWYSKIQTVTVKATPSPTRHPIAAGITPFEVKDEFYYNLRFRERDPRLVPVLTVPMKGEGEQTVAWAVERQDGGRGFGFTGGHFFDNWATDAYRKLALNAILWTAHVPVPEGGVNSDFPKESRAAPKPVEKRLAFADGKFGKALDARVLPARVEGDDRYRKPPLTVECWAKLFSKNGFNVLVSTDPKTSGQHWEIYTYAGKGDFSAYLPGTLQGEIRSGVDVCDGKWHHLAMSHDGKAVRLFVDGNNVKEQPVAYRPEAKPEPGPLVIGGAYVGDQRIGCDGLVDDVRISNVAREIKAAPGVELARDTSTIGLWNLDGDEGISADANWTPPPPAVAGEAWEKETDKDWLDARFSKTDTGPYLNATIDYEGPKEKVRSYKATAIKVGEKGEATVLFDRNQLRLAAAWTGGFLNHSSRRFGLLNTPTPAGQMVFTTPSVAGWADQKGNFESTYPPTGPLPKERAKFKGLYLNGNRTVLSYTIAGTPVLDSPWTMTSNGQPVFVRSIEIGPCDRQLYCLIADASIGTRIEIENPNELIVTKGDQTTIISVAGFAMLTTVDAANDGDRMIALRLPRTEGHATATVVMLPGKTDRRRELGAVFRKVRAELMGPLAKPGPARWTKPITTQLERGKDTGSPFVVDTLPLPYENPWNALFFVTGVDFLPDGRIAICTAHGDVWTAREAGDKVQWQRFATGLYQPLGLKVVDGKIVVLERGQLTRLHDNNNDGEADFYENLNNDWHTGGGEHSFDTCLETDPEGNFYFFKTGDDHTPTGGCLLKVSRDGSKMEVFATGFRHPIGLGVSPDGKIVSGADQEGNWMPVTRLDFYKKGGFYGDMRTHHRSEPPKIYDEPYLWLPKEADNSAGGQVWVPKGSWGALGGHMLHLSYGRCKAYAILPDGDRFQGAAVDLGLTFLSGSARGRFNPKDGHLYVVGLRGWQTAAKKDGSLQRVRYTGKPFPFPVGYAVEPDGVRLTFDQAIDPASVADLSKYKVGRCNYRWGAEYGSKNWSVSDPKKEGIDKVEVVGAALSSDRRSVTIKFADMRPAMHTKVEYDLRSAAGATLAGAVYTTIREWK